MKISLAHVLGLALFAFIVVPRSAEATAFYGYTLGGNFYQTLEEAEAAARVDDGSGGLPFMELSFPIPVDFFGSPNSPSSLDYRPFGALSSGSDILTFGASSVQTSYKPHVLGWPPSTVAPGCANAQCPGGACSSFSDEVALIQCTFDATWSTRPNYSWTRTNSTSSNQITGAPQSITGVGQTSGVLIYKPSSSTATGWGSTISITAQAAPGTSQAPEGDSTTAVLAPESTTQFDWNIQKQDAVTCPTGSGVSGSATSSSDACKSSLRKIILGSPPVTQSPGQCGVGDPCYPSNGNNRASEKVFSYGEFGLDIHYNSLRTTRVYSYIDRNWSHTYAKRIITEWSTASHVSGAETQGVNVSKVFVQDDKADLEVFKPAPVGSGVLRSTSAVGKVLIYMPRQGSSPPFWQLNLGDGVVEVYDRAGRLVQILNADDPGKNVMLSYLGGQIDIDASPSSNGPHMQEDFWRINQIVDGNGRSATFQYSDDNFLWLTRIIADDGITILAEFHYDSEHRLERLTYADMSERTFLYNEPGNIFVGGATPSGIRGFWLTGILDEDNRRYGTFRYDDWGRVVDNWHGADSEKVHIVYGPNDASSTVTFPSGVETTFNYAANEPYRHPEQSTNASGSRSYEYYPTTHRLKKVTDANNNVSEREYDGEGINLEATVEGKNTPEQRRTEFDWDPLTNRLSATRIYKQPNNTAAVLTKTTSLGYNISGALTSVSETDAQTGATSSSTYQYCTSTNASTGCVAGRLHTVDGPRTDVADVTTMRYYTSSDLSNCDGSSNGECHQFGDLKSVTNAVGHTVTYLKYDRAGRILRVRDANSVLTDFSYTSRGWLSDKISRANANGSSSTLDAKTHFTYDNSGNIYRIALPDRAHPLYTMQYTHDSAHRLVGISDAYGNSAAYTLDPNGKRISEEYRNDQGALRRNLSRVYDQFGRLNKLKNAQGVDVISYETPPDSPPPGVSFDGGYDGNGNPVYSVDGLGVDTYRMFDPLNRLKTIMQDHSGPTSPTLNATSQLKYDERDNLTAVIDPENLSTTYVYDGLNNLRSVISPDTGTTTYIPDSAGNRVSQKDARSVTSTYAYDALNRLKSITYLNALQNVTYTYDQGDRQTGCDGSFPTGRLTQMQDESGSTTYCYDKRGNVVRKVQVGQTTREIEYTYDLVDRPTGVTYPSGAIVTYGRDNIGRVTSVTRKQNITAPSETVIQGATYYPFGPLKSLTFGNGRILTKEYDRDYAIDRVYSSAPDGLTIDFTTNVMGNIRDASSSLGAPNKTRTYFYDRLYRLERVEKGLNNPTEIYEYNATGDRTSKKLGIAAPQPYDYIAGTHRLAAVNGVGRSFDEVGNTISRGDGATFTYNERNRRSVVNLPSGFSVKSDAVTPQAPGGPKNSIYYSYNGRGERVGTSYSLNLQSNAYVYDEAGRHLGAYFAFSTQGEEVIYVDGLPVAISNQGTLSYLETDHLGSPRIAASPTDNAQQWKWDLFADAFGDNEPIIAASGGIDVRLRYPGQYADGLGLNYNYFRDYESGTGRYLESDPVGLGGGWNTYGYVGGNPLLIVDPLGLAGCRVNYWGYPITIPDTNTTLSLIHAGILSYDEAGRTSYYEYGRYGSELGNVKRRYISDLEIGPDGKPTEKSWDKLKKDLKKVGKGHDPSLICYDDADARKINEYAERVQSDPDRKPYEWNPFRGANTCLTFARDALEAGRE